MDTNVLNTNKSKVYPPYTIDIGERKYDEKGRWIRDYYNLSIPFDMLAYPSNDKEDIEWRKRAFKEIQPYISLPSDVHSYNGISEKDVLNEVNDKDD